MPEEATEQMVAELAKELIVKGTGITLKFSKTMAEVSARTAAAKASEHRNTGRMSVKRLYKVSKGNLAQIKIDQQSLLKDLEKELKHNGVNYAIEKGHDGSQYLNVSGDDVAHASHIIDQVLAKYAILSDDKLKQSHTQEQEQSRQEQPLADTAEFPDVTLEPEVAPIGPQSLEYIPDQEEADYLDAMGFTEGSQYEPSPTLTDYHETVETIDFIPTHEEAQYMAAMGFQERPPYMRNEETEQAIEEQDEQPLPPAMNQENPSQRDLHQSTLMPDEPEHIESRKESTTVPTNPLVNDTQADPDQDRGTATAESQTAEAIDTREETSAKRTNGQNDRKLTTRQKLRKMISARAQEKMASHNSQRLSQDLKPGISHPSHRK